MRRIALAAPALLLAACSQQTQDDAALTVDLATDDIEANASVVGEKIEDGAAAAADAVADGAARTAESIREGDTEEPGPAPITGDDLNQDRERPTQ